MENPLYYINYEEFSYLQFCCSSTGIMLRRGFELNKNRVIIESMIKTFFKNPDNLKEQCRHNIFTNEVHLFMHCHMKAYDKTGEGINRYNGFSDKYGVPINVEDIGTKGHRAMDIILALNMFEVKAVKGKDVRIEFYRIQFPPVAGYAGTIHLYKKIEGHNNAPWKWTAWIPRNERQEVWDHRDSKRSIFVNSRCFMAFRANEIQNDFWDIHPHVQYRGFDHRGFDQDLVSRHPEWITDLIGHIDKYQGGYFHQGKPWGRYLHVNAIKSIHENPDEDHR